MGIINDNPNGGLASKNDVFGRHNFKSKIVMNPYHRAAAMFEHAMRYRLLKATNLIFIEFLQYLHHDSANGGFYDNENSDMYHNHYAPQGAFKRNDASLYDVI